MNLDQAFLPHELRPSSPNEKYMAALWSEIIGIGADRVGLPHKFLEVGGNSLTLNLILTRIEAEKGAAMDAQLFFDDDRSTLFELAKELDLLLAGRPARTG